MTEDELNRLNAKIEENGAQLSPPVSFLGMGVWSADANGNAATNIRTVKYIRVENYYGYATIEIDADGSLKVLNFT